MQVVEQPLIIDPQELRAWRMRLGVSQTDVAKQANSTQDRVSVIETRVAGTVRTYIAINRALRALEARQQKKAQKQQKAAA